MENGSILRRLPQTRSPNMSNKVRGLPRSSDRPAEFRAVQEARLASRFRVVANLYAFVIVVCTYAALFLISPFACLTLMGLLMLAKVIPLAPKMVASSIMSREGGITNPIVEIRAAGAELNQVVSILVSGLFEPVRLLRSLILKLCVRLGERVERGEFCRVQAALRSEMQPKEVLVFGLLLRPFSTDFRILLVDRDAIRSERERSTSDFYLGYAAMDGPGFLDIGFELVGVTDTVGTRPVEFYDWLSSASAEIAPLITIGLRKDSSYGGPYYIAVEVVSPREQVQDMIYRSSWIIFVPGRSAGVQWEAEQVMGQAIAKAIFVMLPSYSVQLAREAGQISGDGFKIIDPDEQRRSRLRVVWADLVETSKTFGEPLPDYKDDGALLTFRAGSGWVESDFPYTFKALSDIIHQVLRAPMTHAMPG